MRILVTGGAGFIGSHYVRTMLAGGYPGYERAEITVLDKLTYAGNLSNLPVEHPRLRFRRGDICDGAALRRLLPGHAAVVHFAAETHVDRSISGPAEFARTNVLGTQTLLDAALETGVAPVVCVSTDEVYGSRAAGGSDEDTALRPNSPYAASKASADLMVRAYANTYGMEVRLTRCGNNYGRYQYAEKLIPLFVARLLSGEPVPVYGRGHNVREWVHVDDHCRGIQLVLEHGRGGRAYNIGGGTLLTNLEVTDRLLRLCGADWSMVRYVPDRPGHDLRYAVDDARIRTELGYRPRVPFDDGLADVVQWYRDNPGWWKRTDLSRR